MANIKGFDTNTSLVGKGRAAREAGYRFCIRYYGGSGERVLTGEELGELREAGMQVGAVWEVAGMNDLGYFQFHTGLSDATSAYVMAVAAGQPSGSAIYFGVDTDPVKRRVPGPGWDVDTSGIEAYFKGVNQGLTLAAQHGPAYLVGVYGAGTSCAVLKEKQLAAYFWLANAADWSGSDTFGDWHILQHREIDEPSIGVSVDPDEAVAEAGLF